MERPKVLFLLSQSGATPEFVSLVETRRFEVVARPAEMRVSESVLAQKPDLVFLYHGPGQGTLRSWQEVAAEVRRADEAVLIILVTATGSEELAVAALRFGLDDYLALPVSTEGLIEAVERSLGRRMAAVGSRSSLCGIAADRMVGANANLRQMKSYMAKAAASDCTVLITGETGTGKELAAE